MKTYARYKDSGISWIGKIPERWTMKRVASFFDENKETNKNFVYKKSYQFKYGSLVPKNEIGDEKEYEETYVKYTVLNKNDLVFNGLNLNYDFVSQRVAICPAKGIITSAYIAITPRNTIDPMFYCWLFKTMDNKKMFHGMGSGIRLTLSYAELKTQLIPVPPIEEQKSIAAYLDKKTEQINGLVGAKQKQIELLKEYKQSLIANAVTKGINPKVKMKDSGINWIGKVPEHWSIHFLFQKAKEHYISNKNIHHQNLLSLSYGRIIQKDINTTEGLLPESFDTYQIVEDGNIVLRLTDLQNDHKSLRVGYVTQEGIITSAYECLEVMSGYFPKYLYYQLHSFDIKKMFYGMGGGLRQNLNYNELKKIRIAVPPFEEQKVIVEYIENRVSSIDSQISSIEKQIANLNEYKQSLISDVVTGKVKV